MQPFSPSSAASVPEMAALRVCLATAALPAAVRQSLDEICMRVETAVQQRLAQQEERSRQLGHMAARILHEIRNPINATFLHVDVLEEEIRRPSADSQAQMQESIADIRREVTHLYTMMQHYLTLGRLAVIDRTLEDFGTFLQDCISKCQEWAEMRQITYQCTGLADLGSVALHQTTMQQALLYLLEQASEATEAGGTLMLRGRCEHGQVVVEIEYTASQETQKLGALPDAPLSSMDYDQGGLRWHVTREILLAHAANLEVRPGSGRATTYVLTLPLAGAGA